MLFDDSDVKIFNDSESAYDNSYEISVIAEMTKQRSCGNIKKAKELGKQLAEIFVDESSLLNQLEGELGKLDCNDEQMYHIKVLLVFTAEYCINHLLPAAVLSNTAVTSLYDTVVKKASEFYDKLDDAAEYSFYYLAVRKGVEISRNIGISFAMLCGRSDDEYFTHLGERIFEVAQYEIEKIIDGYAFIK